MASLNRAQLIGNLGADPEIRRMTDGSPVASFRIATTDAWKDKKTDEKRERTEWHSVVCFGDGLCGVIEKHVRKGQKIFVEGQLSTRKWTGNDGVDRYSTEVVLRPFVGELILLGGGNRPPAPSEDAYGAGPSTGGGSGGSRGSFDDDIPFAPEWRG
ncbi:MAG: single-stranded DNA-binding protein [Ancylobacter novellus]|uniref:Single-stranded DNA-binding protein n=1 Tax=Ancylobacter novellus TaxID=921 RepID=A0A2W5MGB8_ANCNO|nr:MAG: single-stranded DNA-binding protein [Ancylobacter novellus]